MNGKAIEFQNNLRPLGVHSDDDPDYRRPVAIVLGNSPVHLGGSLALKFVGLVGSPSAAKFWQAGCRDGSNWDT